MITITIDERTRDGRHLLSEAERCKTGVTINSPAINGTAPKGFMTSSDFRKKAHDRLDKFCKDNGIL